MAVQNKLCYDDVNEVIAEEVDVAYSRIMLLGPAGVGKSSLVRGLKKQPFIQEGNSTQVADVRPISCNWATGDWKDVDEQDELDEVAKLLATVYHDRHDVQSAHQLISSVKSVRTLYGGSTSSQFPASTEQELEAKTMKVDAYLEEAMKQANQLTPDDIRVLKPNPILHVWDCGGQPIFLEVLPAFLTPRTEFLLLFDASKDFKQRWKSVQFQQGREIPGEEVNMTISELLNNWMATIHSHLSRKTEKGDLLDYPRILGIGTHGDGLNERKKQGVIDQFNTLCRGKAFSELMDDILVIDNTTAGGGNNGEDPGFERVRESILRFTEKLVVRTPVSWVLFRKIIQMFAKESKNVITFSEAKAIGVACKIKPEDIQKVLMFYHDLGVILYYSHIRNLQDKVILSPRWFVESLGKVLTLQGRETYQTREMWHILRENGILIQPLYVAVWKECEDIDPEGMMELLVSFHLAALVKTEMYYDLNAPQFFVPSVLPLFTGDQASPINAILRATPLHITFSAKFVPPGYFTRFVTTMASFKACQLHFENGIYRNLVAFKFGDGKKYDDVTFTELPGAVQVDIIRNFPDSPEYTSFNVTCQDLFILLEESCKEVDECFHQSSPSNSIHRKFQFLCKSVECSSAANVHYLKDTDEIQTQRDHCSCEGKEKQGMFRRLTEEEAYWFLAVPRQNVKMKRISEQEMLQISREIGGSGEDLAAQMGRLTKWQEIKLDSTAANKILNLLFDWDKGGGEREELVQHLKKLQFTQLAEKLAGNEIDSSNTERRSNNKLKSLLRKRHVSSDPSNLECSPLAVDLPPQSPVSKSSNPPHTPLDQTNLESSPLAVDLPPQSPVSKSSNLPHTHIGQLNLESSPLAVDPPPQSPVSRSSNSPHSLPSQSTHPLQAQPLISQSSLRKTDIRRCCHFVTDDMTLLAGLIGVTDRELADLQQSYSRKDICALRLIEKLMQNDPETNKDDLYQLLVDAEQCDAARSLKN